MELEKFLVNEKITASFQTNKSPQHYIKRLKQQKLTLVKIYTFMFRVLISDFSVSLRVSWQIPLFEFCKFRDTVSLKRSASAPKSQISRADKLEPNLNHDSLTIMYSSP